VYPTQAALWLEWDTQHSTPEFCFVTVTCL
jgi:hypothetical protein